jgi:KDO2-lipid IV(A) lauroyltransferase
MYPAYYPLSNEFSEKFKLDLRTRSKSIPVAQKKILRAIIKLNQAGKKGIFIFIADQSPMWNSVQHWVTFLNQDTATIVAPEKLAKQTGYPVFYNKVRKIKRGYYSSEFIKLVDDPNQIPEFQITERYMDEMQKTINENPAYWLWTHKRWNFVKAAFEKK